VVPNANAVADAANPLLPQADILNIRRRNKPCKN